MVPNQLPGLPGPNRPAGMSWYQQGRPVESGDSLLVAVELLVALVPLIGMVEGRPLSRREPDVDRDDL